MFPYRLDHIFTKLLSALHFDSLEPTSFDWSLNVFKKIKIFQFLNFAADYHATFCGLDFPAIKRVLNELEYPNPLMSMMTSRGVNC